MGLGLRWVDGGPEGPVDEGVEGHFSLLYRAELRWHGSPPAGFEPAAYDVDVVLPAFDGIEAAFWLRDGYAGQAGEKGASGDKNWWTLVFYR